MEDKTKLKIVAIGGIVIIEVTALTLGINGTGLSLTVGAIAGIVGYQLGKKT